MRQKMIAVEIRLAIELLGVVLKPDTGGLVIIDQPDFLINPLEKPNRRRIAIPEYSNSHETAQETNLFRDFAAQAASGKLNEDWPQIALKTQEVMESCLDSARNGNRLTKVAL